jgi:hypothetical protein
MLVEIAKTTVKNAKTAVKNVMGDGIHRHITLAGFSVASPQI